MDLRELLWEKVEPSLYIPKEQFFAELADWEITGHDIEGELAWITCTRGPEFHFQSVGKTKALPIRMIRDFLHGLIAKQGYAITRTPMEDVRQQRFNRRFGFVEVARDIFDIHFRLDKI